ncbi:MAG: succinate dehydrogenase/fumarate reductase iron-sulfur subunit [Cyanobacterium sp. T60_A2020_053]|nr:succinate dehydrogenase/fumarate reductase iron-sulfur subunit [Cyanobacterium sp. T60_A2020_053]
MKVTLKILRQNPSLAPHFQDYTLEVNPENTILECLNKIKWELDGSLTFRKNCRNTICGSCGMKINGRSALACKENIKGELNRLGFNEGEKIPEIVISPFNNLPVIKDLVVKMDQFWQDLEKVDPYVSSKSRSLTEREFLQTPEERNLLSQTGNCILCGACYSECNGKEVNGNFVGPHALAKSYRLIDDSRDNMTGERLKKNNTIEEGVWGCTRCFLCEEVCPMDVAPLTQITKIKSRLLDTESPKDNTPVRHRKVLVDLVKEGGWVDERKFALFVIGNYFRSVKGLLSLIPVGLKVVGAGKMPFSFEPSEGAGEVKSLIEAVQSKKE